VFGKKVGLGLKISFLPNDVNDESFAENEIEIENARTEIGID